MPALRKIKPDYYKYYLNFISTSCYNCCYRHLVTSYSSCFITADHIHAPEGLNSRQLLDDGLPLGHPHHTKGQGDRGHYRETLRDSGYSQTHLYRIIFKLIVYFLKKHTFKGILIIISSYPPCKDINWNKKLTYSVKNMYFLTSKSLKIKFSSKLSLICKKLNHLMQTLNINFTSS